MTDVVRAARDGDDEAAAAVPRRNLHTLAGVRAEKLTGMVVPPSHAPVLDAVVLIWEDGVEVGRQLAEQAPAISVTDDLEASLYSALASAKLCSEYDEFPELDDPDFQDLAYRRVSKLGKVTQPIGHPEITWDMVEIWMDGVAAALRLARARETH